MKLKLMICLSCLLGVLAIVHGGITLATSNQPIWAAASILTGLAALVVIGLAHRKRCA